MFRESSSFASITVKVIAELVELVCLCISRQLVCAPVCTHHTELVEIVCLCFLLDVTGCSEGMQNPSNSVESWALDDAKWSLEEPMPAPLSRHSATTAKGRLYVVGGYNGVQLQNTMYSYDPLERKWSTGMQHDAHSSRRKFRESCEIYLVSDAMPCCYRCTSTLDMCLHGFNDFE